MTNSRQEDVLRSWMNAGTGPVPKYTLSTLRTMHMLFGISYINTYCTLRTRTCNVHIFTDDPNVHENLIIIIMNMYLRTDGF
jgi:hypothetical protein